MEHDPFPPLVRPQISTENEKVRFELDVTPGVLLCSEQRIITHQTDSINLFDCNDNKNMDTLLTMRNANLEFEQKS